MTDEVCKPSRVFEPDEVPVYASRLGTLKASGIHPNLTLEIYGSVDLEKTPAESVTISPPLKDKVGRPLLKLQ
ncbi:unnamed protein product [Leuciscus chuanchicus]